MEVVDPLACRVDVHIVENRLYRAVMDEQHKLGIPTGVLQTLPNHYPGIKDLMWYDIHEYTFRHTDLIPATHKHIRRNQCQCCKNIKKETIYSLKKEGFHHLLDHMWKEHTSLYRKAYFKYLEEKGFLKKSLTTSLQDGYVCFLCHKESTQGEIDALQDWMKYTNMDNVNGHMMERHKIEYGTIMGKENLDQRALRRIMKKLEMVLYKNEKVCISPRVVNRTVEPLGKYRIVCTAVQEGMELEVLVDDKDFLNTLTKCSSYLELEACVNFNKDKLYSDMCEFEDRIKAATDKFLGTPKELSPMEAKVVQG